MFTPFSIPVEQAMRLTFSSLNERQRRLYAAAEALKLGHGGLPPENWSSRNGSLRVE
jgi:hypothetical protein